MIEPLERIEEDDEKIIQSEKDVHSFIIIQASSLYCLALKTIPRLT